MTNKDKLSTIKEIYKEEMNSLYNGYTCKYSKIHRCDEEFEAIEKDLDRLEKYDKAIEIIKIKNVDLRQLLLLYHTFPGDKLYMYNRDTIKNEQLTQDEFDLIIEVFG